MPKYNFDIDAALEEVQEKSMEEIEQQTAIVWASRSMACFKLYEETNFIKWLLKGEDFRHEAIEHAALVKDDGKVLKIVDKEIQKYRTMVDEKEEVKKESRFAMRFKKLAVMFPRQYDLMDKYFKELNEVVDLIRDYEQDLGEPDELYDETDDLAILVKRRDELIKKLDALDDNWRMEYDSCDHDEDLEEVEPELTMRDYK